MIDIEAPIRQRFERLLKAQTRGTIWYHDADYDGLARVSDDGFFY
jgi:hypothetical protein